MVRLPGGEGRLVYREVEPGLLSYWHTEVDSPLRGQGVGDALVRAAMDFARQSGQQVLPDCPFVMIWLKKHPEYQDVIRYLGAPFSPHTRPSPVTSSTTSNGPIDTDAAWQVINSIRVLSMDAVEAAQSGHPGTPMALAPVGYLLWRRYLKHAPRHPTWPGRDRFLLSNGHASMLLYSLLHLSGYDLSLDDIKKFRQWGSKTPGHPEHGHTEGVETTPGPMGQGLGNAVGMAIAERLLASQFGTELVDHRTWVFASDGDMMEGVGHEAASLMPATCSSASLTVIYDEQSHHDRRPHRNRLYRRHREALPGLWLARASRE